MRWVLLFVLGVIAILMVSPLILTVFTSLKPTTELVNPPWYPPIDITFEHYVRVWTDGGFNRYFFNTLIISVVDAIAMIVIASLAAYAMVFVDFRGKLATPILGLCRGASTARFCLVHRAPGRIPAAPDGWH